ncbi:hypothetical protein ACFV0T_08965 [Streptomyces sp. NPDC059582]|uniref:hypothetical protein n=1 Tax=Streptomyces sp. NPDC059582 TaxID=3346875 RepID=UPI00368B6B70
MRRTVMAAAVAALLAGVTLGCAPDGGTARKSPAAPSGYTEMQKKVDAAESALARADEDAAQDDADR